MKKVKRTTQRNKCDKLFSEKIRRAGACKNCGGTYLLQCAHLISRSYYATRWDEDNACCLDSKCHVYFTHHPLEFEVWVDNTFGEDKYFELKQRALSKLTDKIDYDQIIERLKA